MGTGVIQVAPGQHGTILRSVAAQGIRTIVDAELEVDMKFGTPTGKPVMIEIKIVPDDLVSSWRDGRLTRQSMVLGANAGPSILLCIGTPIFERNEWQILDDEGHGMGLDLFEMMGRELTLAMTGVATLWVPDIQIAGKVIANLYFEFQKKEHLSHLTRPNFAGSFKMTTWPKPTRAEELLYIWQGFRGVGRTIGKSIWKYTGTLRAFAMANEDQLKAIPKIGKVRARALNQMLDAKYTDYFDDGDEDD